MTSRSRINAIVEAVKERPYTTAPQIAEACGFGSDATRDTLFMLEDVGVTKSMQRGRAFLWCLVADYEKEIEPLLAGKPMRCGDIAKWCGHGVRRSSAALHRLEFISVVCTFDIAGVEFWMLAEKVG